jgi:hypothetical protein
VKEPRPTSAKTKCLVCPKKRPKKAVEHRDAFCSVRCCKAFHHVVYPEDQFEKKPNKVRRQENE